MNTHKASKQIDQALREETQELKRSNLLYKRGLGTCSCNCSYFIQFSNINYIQLNHVPNISLLYFSSVTYVGFVLDARPACLLA